MTACSKLPVTWVSAVMKRLPNEWPLSSEPSLSNRYAKSLPTVDSASESATRQLRISPGAGISNSLRIRPVEPPSSATVTIAVIPASTLRRPRRSVESPVPPPIATIFMAGRIGPEAVRGHDRADTLMSAGWRQRAGSRSERVRPPDSEVEDRDTDRPG